MPVVEPMNGDGSTRVVVNDVEDAGIVELVGPSSVDTPESSISIADDQIAPLLSQSERPKINIFTLSYPRQKLNKEEAIRVVEPNKSPFLQFIFWLWSGSRYSGLLCIVLSCTIYSLMEVVSDVFTAQSVPLFEIAFARCTVVLILSFVWLSKSGQPIFGPTSARKLLVLRALSGCISLLSFIYSIQRLPVSQAIILSFTAPIMASTVARVTLDEKLKIAEIGGLASSFFGVLFIFQPMVRAQVGDCVLMRPADSGKPPYVAKVDRIELDHRNHVKVRVQWYYRPEESVGGRRQFHGAKELFLSDHYDFQSANTIEGKCIVHSFRNYTKLENVGPEDYFCRFDYKAATGGFTPDRVAVYCKCEMPYNPDDLMVQCEGCKDWFHPLCMGMTIEEAKKLDPFLCSDCSSEDDDKQPLNSFHVEPKVKNLLHTLDSLRSSSITVRQCISSQQVS